MYLCGLSPKMTWFDLLKVDEDMYTQINKQIMTLKYLW